MMCDRESSTKQTDKHTQNSGRAQKRDASSDIGSVAAPALKKGIYGNC